jgi:hypothetical protein
MSVNYSGEIDIHGSASGQFAFYAPAGANNLNINYMQGENPITVSGMRDLPPPPASQEPGSNKTYEIPNPEVGALVQYSGALSLQWNWLP